MPIKRPRDVDSSAIWRAADRKLLAKIAIPSAVNAQLTNEQLEAYQIIFRIQEITAKLVHDEFLHVPPAKEQEAAPKYDSSGKRINTRESVYREKLLEERNLLVEIANRAVPGFCPPADYVKPSKLVDKVYIPTDEYPSLNFQGLIFGPRGRSIRKLCEQTGAKIQIRGKLSVKQGKNQQVNEQYNDLNEPLHCLITSDNEASVQNAVQAITELIAKIIATPEGQNDWKRDQLRELAAINGTLREYEDRPCQICGEMGHRRYNCPKKQQHMHSIVCNRCGNLGHFARDCTAQDPGQGISVADQEYQQMLEDLNGEDNPAKRRHVDLIQQPYLQQLKDAPENLPLPPPNDVLPPPPPPQMDILPPPPGQIDAPPPPDSDAPPPPPPEIPPPAPLNVSLPPAPLDVPLPPDVPAPPPPDAPPPPPN